MSRREPDDRFKIKRATVPALEEKLGIAYPVLDHGFIRLVDFMGDQPAIVQAARVSYGKGTKTVNKDRGLIRYLMRHRHTTPLEMCEIKLHIKLPIFVARQWIRHRTASVNEYSARYSILANEFYVPEIEDVQPQSTENHQGRGGELPETVRRAMVESIRLHSDTAYGIYEELYKGWNHFDPGGTPWDTYFDLDEEQYARSIAHPDDYDKDYGMARELARMVVPTNVYTEMYWKVDLHNLLHFLSLRADPHAQKEIRVYADAILGIVEAWVPAVWEAFQDYVMGAETFSRQEMEIIRALVEKAAVGTAPNFLENLVGIQEGMSKRERAAFLKKVEITDDH